MTTEAHKRQVLAAAKKYREYHEKEDQRHEKRKKAIEKWYDVKTANLTTPRKRKKK